MHPMQLPAPFERFQESGFGGVLDFFCFADIQPSETEELALRAICTAFSKFDCNRQTVASGFL
jgi:hypothetical protein